MLKTLKILNFPSNFHTKKVCEFNGIGSPLKVLFGASDTGNKFTFLYLLLSGNWYGIHAVSLK